MSRAPSSSLSRLIGSAHLIGLAITAAVILSACTLGPERTFGMYIYDPAITMLSSAPTRGLGPDATLERFTARDGSIMIAIGPAALDERCIKDAKASFGPDGKPVLIIQFKSRCAKTLAAFTSANVGKMMLVAANGQVISTPIISEAIHGGQIVIEGEFEAIGY